MTLPASGAIRLGADASVEVGYSGTSLIALGGTDIRALYQISSGEIRLAADGYSKSYTNALIKRFINARPDVGGNTANEIIGFDRVKLSNGHYLLSGKNQLDSNTSLYNRYWSNQFFIGTTANGALQIAFASNNGSNAVVSTISVIAARGLPWTNSQVANSSLITGVCIDGEYRASDGMYFLSQPVFTYTSTTSQTTYNVITQYGSTGIHHWSSNPVKAIGGGTNVGMMSPNGIGFIDIDSTGNAVSTSIIGAGGIYMAKWNDTTTAFPGTISASNSHTGNATIATVVFNQQSASRTRLGGVSYLIYSAATNYTIMNVFYPETLAVNTTITLFNGYGGTNSISKATTNDGTYIYNAGTNHSVSGPCANNIYVTKISTAAVPQSCWKSNFGYPNFVLTGTNSGIDLAGIAANSTTILIAGHMSYGTWTTSPVTYNKKFSFLAKFNIANSTIYSLWKSANNTLFSTLDYDNTNDILILSAHDISDASTSWPADILPSYWAKIPMASLDSTLTNLGFTENSTINAIGNPISFTTLATTSYAALAATTNNNASTFTVNRYAYPQVTYTWT